MTHKISLVDSDKFFFADFSKTQPTEAIILHCLHHFKLKVPDDHTKCKLFAKDIDAKDVEVVIHCEDTSRRWGWYKIPDDAELFFEP